MAFVKHDKEKSRVDLLEPEFILLMGKVLGFGAVKYSEDNWKGCDDDRRYLGACLRHILAAMTDGVDSESGLPHLAHAAVCAMMAWWVKENNNGG